MSTQTQTQVQMKTSTRIPRSVGFLQTGSCYQMRTVRAVYERVEIVAIRRGKVTVIYNNGQGKEKVEIRHILVTRRYTDE